jgi:hypothetical protein
MHSRSGVALPPLRTLPLDFSAPVEAKEGQPDPRQSSSQPLQPMSPVRAPFPFTPAQPLLGLDPSHPPNRQDSATRQRSFNGSTSPTHPPIHYTSPHHRPSQPPPPYSQAPSHPVTTHINIPTPEYPTGIPSRFTPHPQNAWGSYTPAQGEQRSQREMPRNPTGTHAPFSRAPPSSSSQAPLKRSQDGQPRKLVLKEFKQTDYYLQDKPKPGESEQLPDTGLRWTIEPGNKSETRSITYRWTNTVPTETREKPRNTPHQPGNDKGPQ